MANEKEGKKVTFIEKLHNFRLQTILFAIGGLLTTLITVVFLVFFQLNRMYMGSIDRDTLSTVNTDNQVLGFIMFMVAVVTIVVGVLEVYNAVPYIQKKDKLSVKKWFAALSIAEAILSLTMLIFSVINLTYIGTMREIVNEQEQWIAYTGKAYFWIPCIVLFAGVMIYNLIAAFPTFSVKTYLPENIKPKK